MEITWSDNDCDAIYKFVDHVLTGFVAIVSTDAAREVPILVGGCGHNGEGGLLRLFGQVLDPETFDLVQPRRHAWFTWDDITRLEVH